MKSIKKFSLSLILMIALIVQTMAFSFAGAIEINNSSKANDEQIIVNDYEAKISGSFVQSWLANSWSSSKWDKEMAIYKQTGMEYLILADVANENEAGEWGVFYPSNLPELLNGNCYGDVIDKALTAAKKAGIKVFIGMGGSDKWWKTGASGVDYENYCKLSAKIAKEIYTMYKEKYADTFYGWYYVPEIFNTTGVMTGPNVDKLIAGFNVIIDGINSTGDKDMPVMLSPFLNTKGYNLPLSTVEIFYKKFFDDINFRKGDIFCPQDSVGAGGVSIKTVEDCYKMYKNAIDYTNAKGKGIKFWANCEDFSQIKQNGNSDAFHTADLNKFIKQMTIAQKYCQRIITFSYSHYQSPNNINEIFHNAYLKYAKNGFVEEIAPTSVEKIKTVYDDLGQLNLEWTQSTDDSGISRYLIKKDNRMSDFVTVNRIDGGGGITRLTPKYLFRDFQVPEAGEKVIIEIIPYDVYGNIGVGTKIEVTKDNLNNGVDLGNSDGEYVQALKGYDFLPLYDFDFWENGDLNIGTAKDPNNYIIESHINTGAYGIKATDKKALKEIGMEFNARSSGSFEGITVDALHSNNPERQTNFGKSEYFSFYIDTTNRATTLRTWVILYDMDRVSFGYTAFAPIEGSPCFIEENGEMIEMSCGDQSVSIPGGYKGRVYIPINEKTFQAIWGTEEENKNGKIDLGCIGKFKLSFDNIGSKGSSFLVDEIGFFRDPTLVPDDFVVPEPEVKLGDVNMDGEVTTLDVLAVLKHLAMIDIISEPYLIKAADFNQDTSISTFDALCMLKFIAKI